MTASSPDKPKSPPWDWSALGPNERAQQWRDLARWVEWLQTAYDQWLNVPACWSQHEGLSLELRVFYYWHQLVTRRSANPVDAIRWHQDLRRSAQAWSALSTCAHEPLTRHRAAADATRTAASRRWVERAILDARAEQPHSTRTDAPPTTQQRSP